VGFCSLCFETDSQCAVLADLGEEMPEVLDGAWFRTRVCNEGSGNEETEKSTTCTCCSLFVWLLDRFFCFQQMQAGNAKLFSVDVVFNEKQNQKVVLSFICRSSNFLNQFTFFVPGEEVSGTAYFKFPQSTAFQTLHFEVVGQLSLKHLFCSDPKKTKLPLSDMVFDKTFRGAGFSYKARSGDDKARSLSVTFNFTMPRLDC
jgi:hypothetical protein